MYDVVKEVFESLSLNIFYCNILHIHVCSGVGPQVLTILVVSVPLHYCFNKLQTCDYDKTSYTTKNGWTKIQSKLGNK